MRMSTETKKGFSYSVYSVGMNMSVHHMANDNRRRRTVVDEKMEKRKTCQQSDWLPDATRVFVLTARLNPTLASSTSYLIPSIGLERRCIFWRLFPKLFPLDNFSAIQICFLIISIDTRKQPIHFGFLCLSSSEFVIRLVNFSPPISRWVRRKVIGALSDCCNCQTNKALNSQPFNSL